MRFVSILTLLVTFEDNWIVEMEMNHWMSFLPCTYVDQACQSPYEAHKNIGIIQISLCNLKPIDKFFSKNWHSFEFRCNWFSILLISYNDMCWLDKGQFSILVFNYYVDATMPGWARNATYKYVKDLGHWPSILSSMIGKLLEKLFSDRSNKLRFAILHIEGGRDPLRWLKLRSLFKNQWT